MDAGCGKIRKVEEDPSRNARDRERERERERKEEEG
jgi:hypothetical protein